MKHHDWTERMLARVNQSGGRLLTEASIMNGRQIDAPIIRPLRQDGRTMRLDGVFAHPGSIATAK